jgi:arginine N-succinyltransferase
MIVRPATPDDLPALLSLAHSAGTGLTTLPADASRLRL